jgi:hypothetical protein
MGQREFSAHVAVWFARATIEFDGFWSLACAYRYTVALG